MFKEQIKIIYTLILIVSVSSAVAQDIYVDKNALGAKNGTSWSNAYTTVTDALKKAETDNTIHIAEGIYNGELKSTAFSVNKSVTIIGGYASGGKTHNHKKYKTILDGGNTRRVINIARKSTLKALTIQNGMETDFDGGGLRASASVTLEHCIIRKNTCTKSKAKDVFGGGIFSGSNLKLINCVILDNIVSNTNTENNNVKGGGIFVKGTFQASNCIIINNSAVSENGIAYGAGLYVAKQAEFINTLVAYNTAVSSNFAEAGGFYASGTTGSNSKAIRLRNSIIYKNLVSVDGGKTKQYSEYSINGPSKGFFNGVCSFVKGEKIDGFGNIDDSNNSFDPQFTSPENFDFTLKSTSKLINKGKEKYNKTLYDLAGNIRLIGKIDIGPFENKN